ncbi:MAG: glycosyltransferase family 39 protein [Acidobacteria bacterium]|nr:glycosyltransferase family 39 protein [Acidobacteriota bacterium]
MATSSPLAFEDRQRGLHAILALVFVVCIARLWLMPLGSSFWVDELVTFFVVHHGTSHPSLAVAPQVSASIYYALPQAAEALLGFSEIAYRLPSVLAMATALLLITRLAARLVHPRAGWFAAFACLALSGINYQAADARPYGLGTCVAVASFWFLVRWLDTARWTDGLLFVLSAGLLWRVHLIYWPLYIVFFLYAVVRLSRRETNVRWLLAVAVLALLGVILLPVLVSALAILRQAASHAFAPVPEYRALFNSLKLGLVVVCGVMAWLLRRWQSARPPASDPEDVPVARIASWSTLALVGGWWLLHPLCLFVYSRLSGNSVFLSRYLSVALLGGVLAAVCVAGLFMPPACWRKAALLLGVGVLLLMGQWGAAWPRHDESDWRGAAHQLQELGISPDTPVITPSPFYEARPPVWSPDYALPGFLYAHFEGYPIPGAPILFPFAPSPEAFQYAITLTQQTLSTTSRFAIYGGDRNARTWRDWFAARPELAGWRQTTFNQFGNIWVVLFERSPDAAPASDH